MIGIITGDIVNSRKLSSKIWIDGLKNLLNTFGENPVEWDIYRGDEFQLEVKNPEEALIIALQIKSYFKTLKLDVRMSIGFGDITYKAKKISESNGTAFIRSGELFETLKKQKNNLAINSGNEVFDTEINLMLRLSLTFMNNWLVQSADFVLTAIENPSLSQEEIGVKLGINQAAVSRRRKRAQFDLVMEMENYFRNKIKTIST
ncbi:SatD family (SatD) [Flavobacterium fluvii]|uniref:SatD family (SatD) n=1 Tax=Flavobacterium fluvii TaxID=468056 RepID=A0A1M5L0G9_9FLAO|nr:SatD family protein [Flavobacterium fluvii]SHG58517.1 SatD family (SatD) [Flavobacterium fluvii]